MPVSVFIISSSVSIYIQENGCLQTWRIVFCVPFQTKPGEASPKPRRFDSFRRPFEIDKNCPRSRIILVEKSSQGSSQEQRIQTYVSCGPQEASNPRVSSAGFLEPPGNEFCVRQKKHQMLIKLVVHEQLFAQSSTSSLTRK